MPKTDTEPHGRYSPADLQAFRSIVREELELPPTIYEDKDTIWISKLPGSKQSQSAP